MGNQLRSYHKSSGERDNKSLKEMAGKGRSLEIFRELNWEDLDEWVKREDQGQNDSDFMLGWLGGWRFLKHKSGV